MRLPVELLAPAGSPEAARAAVQNGADAIYLGGKQFSARQYANNFDEDEILEILRYCHVYGVKVYVTVNTLVDDDEFESALKYLRFLYQSGVDAVIMQDLGLIQCAAELVPGLTIHASTQMTIHNSPGIEFLEGIGVKRVVVAREMSLEEIRKVREKTNMELEIFVHGALCIGYSGQCLLSSMIGGRSGNRGRCAQPCRLPYSIQENGNSSLDNKYRYLLSPKDLNLLEHLPKLIEAGVSGLKIEGRMKRAEYVAVVVSVYREALDRYARGPDNYTISSKQHQDLAQVFNREFTTGYLLGNPGQALMSVDRPNNRGIFLGRVSKVDRETGQITIRNEADLRMGDEIEVWVTTGGRKEIKVNQLFQGNSEVERVPAGGKAQVKLQTIKGIHPGDRVFKTNDAQLIALARKSFTSPVRKRKIPISLNVKLHPGKPLILTGKDDRGNNIIVSSEGIAEKAQKRPLTKEAVHQQLDRMGNTPFDLHRVSFDIDPEVIIALREINQTRRKLVELMEDKRSQIKLPEGLTSEEFQTGLKAVLDDCSAKAERKSGHPVISVSVGDAESAQAAIERGAGRVYLGGENFQGKRFSRQDIENVIRLGQKWNCEVYIGLPRIFQENDIIEVKRKIEESVGLSPSGYSSGNLGSLQLLKSFGVNKIHADYPLNIFNRQSACFCLDNGAASFTLSMELNMQKIGGFGALLTKAECLVHGSPPLMVSQHCVLSTADNGRSCRQACKNFEGLKDRMNLTFPVRMDSECRMFIFNSKELCLIENLSSLDNMGVKYLRIEANIKSRRYVERVVSEYSKILKLASSGVDTEEAAAAARAELEELAPQGITKGHYFRGA